MGSPKKRPPERYMFLLGTGLFTMELWRVCQVEALMNYGMESIVFGHKPHHTMLSFTCPCLTVSMK